MKFRLPPTKYEVTMKQAVGDYLKKMGKEIYDGLDSLVRRGYEELGNAHLFGHAVSYNHYRLDPHALPEYGPVKPAEPGADVHGNDPTNPSPGPAREILPPDSPGPATHDLLQGPLFDQPKTPELTGPEYKLLTGPPDAPSIEAPVRVPSLPSPSAFAMERIELPMPGKSLIDTIVDGVAKGRDDFVTVLENPMTGVAPQEMQAPEVQAPEVTAPDPSPAPEPQPEMEMGF